MSQPVSTLPRGASRISLTKLVALAIATIVACGGANCANLPPPGGSTCATILSQNSTQINSPPIILAQDHVQGSANAPVTVVEYADFQCPFCGRFARETYPTIKQNYIDTGKVRWIFRHFPLRNIHPNAEKAAQGSECADDQNAFWPYHDRLFQQGASLAVADLKAYAGQLMLNTSSFDACIDGDGKAPRVQGDLDSGAALGVSGTPAFFINNRRVVGFRNAADFSAILDCVYEQATAGGGS